MGRWRRTQCHVDVQPSPRCQGGRLRDSLGSFDAGQFVLRFLLADSSGLNFIEELLGEDLVFEVGYRIFSRPVAKDISLVFGHPDEFIDRLPNGH